MTSRCKASSSFEKEKSFWRALFEEHEIARKIPSLVCDNRKKSEINGYYNSFYVADFGEVLLNVEPASSLGDNFFSDTYLIEAKILKTNTSLNVFAKVGIILSDSFKKHNPFVRLCQAMF